MKIAFTSCASPKMVPVQPVWGHIANGQPDVLVLLGDNIYTDVPDVGMDQLQQMSSNDFAIHMLQRYREQLAIEPFGAVIRNANIVKYAIWDDHDFLWNDAQGRRDEWGGRYSQHVEKMLISTNLMRCFREALAAHDPALFPSASNDSRIWIDYSPPLFRFNALGLQSIPLDEGKALLHLTDGRSFRSKSQLLGTRQRAQLTRVFEDAPSALHIIASGTTFAEGAASWSKFPEDRAWLLSELQGRGWLMLSGDIHKNMLSQHTGSEAGKLVEATASGAAILAYLNKIIQGPEVCHHGEVSLGNTEVAIKLFSFGQTRPEWQARYSRTPGGSLMV